MGIALEKMFRMFFSKAELRLLMVGLDAAGKTTILYKMKLGEVVTTIPTIGTSLSPSHCSSASLHPLTACVRLHGLHRRSLWVTSSRRCANGCARFPR